MERSAWITITGKVFVSQSEIDERVILFQSYGRVYSDEVIFKEIAKEKIAAMFPSDDPFKFNEVEFASPLTF